jgi:hypothetical protein
VCQAIDTSGLPYVLVPDAAATVFTAPTSLLARLVKPPAREIPGVRLAARPDFDVTPEHLPDDRGIHGEPAWRLGEVLDADREAAGALALPERSLLRHTFVCGATGAGKSQTVRGLLETATSAGVPWLVVEPAKAEYRAMANRIGAEVIVIHPGGSAFPAGLNPLEPSAAPDGRRFPLQTHIDLVKALFVASFQAVDPFPQVMAEALTRCYTGLGWNLALDRPVGAAARYPTLRELELTADQVVRDIGYGTEVASNVRGFIKVRLASLRHGAPGRFFEGGHRVDLAALLTRNVVFEIEDVGDDQDKAFLMGTVLVRLAEQLRLAGPASRLKHLTVIEEAHRLLRANAPGGPGGQGGAASHATEMFAGLLAEIRAYGEGLIIAEQIPAKLVPDVIKNTAVKIVHRLPAADDRAAVGATMNATEAQSRFIVSLVPGEAAVFADGMDFPVLARMPDGTAREAAREPVTANAARLVTPRSPACGPLCRNGPCTLPYMEAAQDVLACAPHIELWAEVTVANHLAGVASPVPRQPLLDALYAHDSDHVRVRDCVLAQAVDAAVSARAAALRPLVAADDLAAHVTASLRAAVANGQACRPPEPEWVAPAYRSAVEGGLARITAFAGPAVPPGPLRSRIGVSPQSDNWAEACQAAFRSFSRFFTVPSLQEPARAEGDLGNQMVGLVGRGSSWTTPGSPSSARPCSNCLARILPIEIVSVLEVS